MEDAILEGTGYLLSFVRKERAARAERNTGRVIHNKKKYCGKEIICRQPPV